MNAFSLALPLCGSILTVTTAPPPSQGPPLEKPSVLARWWGFFQVVLSWVGGGAIRINYSSKELLGYIMASNFVHESTCFVDKSVEL